MDRSSKHQLVKDLKEQFQDVSLMVIATQKGVTVGESYELRTKMREADVSFKVVKNTLLRLAVKETSLEVATPLFKGPTTIAYAQDAIAPAKVLVNFIKDCPKLEVLGGVLNGALLDAKAIEALSKLPSLDELRGKLVGVLQAPAQKIARVLKAPGEQVARVLGAYSQK